MKKIAVITGTSSGIGRSILNKLLKICDADGPLWEAYGLCRTASAADTGDDLASRYHPIRVDLSKPNEIEAAVKTIRSQAGQPLDLLINNAGCAFYGLHEELSPSAIHKMLAVNLEAPLILTSLLLRDLKASRGTIINISSVTATHPAPKGAAYGASKAGLSAFGRSLFEEARKYGVKVINLQPDMTDTDLYRKADFTCDSDPLTHLEAEEIAEAVAGLLDLREGLTVTELTLRPQINKISKKKPAD